MDNCNLITGNLGYYDIAIVTFISVNYFASCLEPGTRKRNEVVVRRSYLTISY